MLISIITPCFNASQTISATIESVIKQSYSFWELIIVDDCSTDSTEVEVAPYLEDKRIKYYRLDTNSGSPAEPRNKGLEIATGQYIAFLDADDTWNKNKLSTQVNYIQNYPDFKIFCSAYDLLDLSRVKLATYTPPQVATYSSLLKNNSIGCLSAIVNSDVIGDTRFPKCGHEDFAFWLKLTKQGYNVFGIQESLANYTVMENSVSSDKKKLVGFFWNIYRNEEGFSVIKSLYLCAVYLINVLWFKYK